MSTASLSKAFWSFKKFRATVINDIWIQVTFFTLISVVITCVSKLTSTSLAISNQMLTVLGTVIALVMSFRTSTAYERFSEGRKLWTSIAVASRNLAQVIWIHVPFEQKNQATEEKKPILKVVIEKKSMINLIQVFSESLKHFLRGEAGVYYADLYPLIASLPRFSRPHECTEDGILPLWEVSGMNINTHAIIHSKMLGRNVLYRSASEPTLTLDTESESDKKWFRPLRKARIFDPEKALPVLPSEHPLQPAKNPPKASLYKRYENQNAPTARRSLTGKKMRPEMADCTVPIEITLFLSTYLASLMKQGLLTPASATAMVNAISTLQDTLYNLERIQNTPLPFAYQVHLRTSLCATTFVSFLLLGFLEIGQEIENPFDYDLNDLDLDHFCLSLQRELHEITAHTVPDPDEFIFTRWNQPFAPADRRSAKEMLDDLHHPYHDDGGVHHIRKTLLTSWREVEHATRKH